MLRRPALLCVLFFGSMALVSFGCSRPQPTVAPAKPVEVKIETPIIKEVTEYEDFTGRTEAKTAVDIRARVTGYLKEITFKDGDDVEKGAVLFKIDPVLYEAERDRAESAVAVGKALVSQGQIELARAQKDFDRVSKTPTAASREELDRIVADRDKAQASLVASEASVKVATAQLKIAQQNYEWTEIRAPISGRLSRRVIDGGNLVKADDTVLTSIVSLDPIAVNFDIDDRTMLRVRKLIREGKVVSARRELTRVQIGLPDEEAHSFQGAIDFIDNRLDAGTGTLRVRAEAENVAVNKVWLLSPGQFVRVRLPIGKPRTALLIPVDAVATDQGLKIVYVVGDDGKVLRKPVEIGLQFDQYREILKGLTEKDRVIVEGYQRVRPGAQVTPKVREKKDAAPKDAPPKDAAPKPVPPKDASSKPAPPVAPTPAAGS